MMEIRNTTVVETCIINAILKLTTKSSGQIPGISCSWGSKRRKTGIENPELNIMDPHRLNELKVCDKLVSR